MEEQFETFKEEGEPTGLVARSRVHEQGLWHKTSNVFLFRSDGRLITQKRHASKDVWPGAWDLSVAEHLEPGEDFLDGAVRGLSEELGIVGVRLETASDVIRTKLEVPEHDIKDFEIQMCFRGTSDAELKPQSSEIAELRLIELGELQAAMRELPNEFTPWFRRCAQEIGVFG